MDYINEINIMEATIHVLDNNADEPVLNEFPLELTEEVYSFIFKHTARCLNDENLKYAVFTEEMSTVRKLSFEYLNGENSLINISKELAAELFNLMRRRGNIPACDLLTVGFTTEYGPFIGIFKMDYIKNYMHDINFIEKKVGINVIPQFTGLPASSAKIQKCAFIKAPIAGNKFDLLVIDKQSKVSKIEDDYGKNYFMDNYLGCRIITNDRDNTKNFIEGTERFIRGFTDDAESAEEIREKVREKLTNEEEINLEEIGDMMPDVKSSYLMQMSKSCDDKFSIDKKYVEKKLKRIRLKVDKEIDIYLSQEAYKDKSKFEVVRNGDGTINMLIKHIKNYIEK